MTPPCTQALIESGIKRFVFAAHDANVEAAGGVQALQLAGIEVDHGLEARCAQELNFRWNHSVRSGRPYIIAKYASSLDGYVAAQDGSSQWITSDAARHHAHQFRAEVDAVIFGTGTILADNPQGTARKPDGHLYAHQPLRVAVGKRQLPPEAAIVHAPGSFVHIHAHELNEVLNQLQLNGVRVALIDGGPRLVTAFLEADLVDELHAYIAPIILGEGVHGVGEIGITTLAHARRFEEVRRTSLGPDTLIVLRR
jgi:diaminohydroxyphosphoribosylaminopyrimidine deaminase/5-amino-6-(5-phosphoribosylamino)uracil reductase